MDRSAIAKPDVFLAHYLSLTTADEDDTQMSATTALALTAVFLLSAVVCGLAIGLLS